MRLTRRPFAHRLAANRADFGGSEGRGADDVLQRNTLLGEHHRRLRRCRAMSEALSGSRDAFRRIGNIAKAAHYGRSLVVAETLAPGASATASESAP